MKDCAYKRWIHRFIDGELSDSDKAEFEKHLSSCDSCKEEVLGFQGLRNILSSAREEMFLPELKLRVIEGIDRAETSAIRLNLQVVLLYRRLAPVLAAVAIIFTALSMWEAQQFNYLTDSAIAFLEDREAQLPEIEVDIF